MRKSPILFQVSHVGLPGGRTAHWFSDAYVRNSDLFKKAEVSEQESLFVKGYYAVDANCCALGVDWVSASTTEHYRREGTHDDQAIVISSSCHFKLKLLSGLRLLFGAQAVRMAALANESGG